MTDAPLNPTTGSTDSTESLEQTQAAYYERRFGVKFGAHFMNALHCLPK